MRAISDPIKAGAEGFLNVQYMAVLKYAVPLGFGIFLSYLWRPVVDDVGVGRFSLGVVAALCFYTSMYVASLTNIRVASAARRSYGEGERTVWKTRKEVREETCEHFISNPKINNLYDIP